MAYYFDTSALVKLVVPETESPALRSWLGSRAARAVTSDLARVELWRAVRRNAPEAARQAGALLDGVVTTGITREILDEAARLGPPELCSLDAIHLATALDLGRDLEGFVTYDERLAAAARSAGLVVVQPR